MQPSRWFVTFTKSSVFPSSLALLMVAIACSGDAKHPPAAAVVSPEKLAESLDALIQPRFQVNAGDFGLARIGVVGHTAVLNNKVTTAFEKQLETNTKKSNRNYTVGFFHCADKPGKFKTNISGMRVWPTSKPLTYTMFYQSEEKIFSKKKIVSNGVHQLAAPGISFWNNQTNAAVQSLCVKALPKLKQGESVDAAMGKWLVAMRPIRALNASCIGCHAGAQKGDTLGVMVYTISKTMLAP